MADNHPTLLRVTDVSFTFCSQRRVRAVLSGVDLEVEGGEICTVIGKSGVGKSTLLRIMAGQLAPDTGHLRLAPARPNRMQVLYHPQEALALPWASVAENAVLGLRFTGLAETMPVCLLLSRLDLQGLEERHPARLSGGQIERVALARTLLTPADVYLFDEPLAGTDYPRRVEIEDFLVNFVSERDAAAVVVTHDVPQAVAISSRIYLLVATGGGASALTIHVPSDLRVLPPKARRASTLFGPFVSELVHRLGGSV